MDKETALKWLEHCLIVEGACTGCPFDPTGKMDFKDCKRILFENISALVNDSVPVQESNLIRKKERVKFLPCRCGYNRREHWFAAGNDMQEILVCKKCGFEVRGKNEEDARRNWNEAVKNG